MIADITVYLIVFFFFQHNITFLYHITRNFVFLILAFIIRYINNEKCIWFRSPSTHQSIFLCKFYPSSVKVLKEKLNSYSDKDIDIISKKNALDKYWDYILNKRVVAHYKMYITELSQRKIDLQVLDKAMRMWVWN